MLLQKEEFVSCRFKIQRAQEHLQSLEAEISTWLKKDPLKLVKHADESGTRHRVLVEVANAPPLTRWSLISGDCVHNLRSALDSFIYEMAIRQKGVLSPTDERNLCFPILNTPVDFNKQRYKISALASAVQVEIEKLQPYNGSADEFPPLRFLAALNNQDKHRMLNVVAASPHSASVTLPPQLNVSGVSAQPTSIEGMTEILSFNVEPATPNLQYECEATVLICFSNPQGFSKGPFSELLGVLALMLQEVERVTSILACMI